MGKWISKSAAFWRWLGASLVVFAFSERVFWAFWRKEDSADELAVTFATYGLIVVVAQFLFRRYRVQEWHRIFLVGALVGWLAEGVVVTTALGDGTNPFPLSISFTGLSWHAPLSVLFGLWWLPKAVVNPDPGPVIKASAGLGVGWGLWAGYYKLEAGTAATTLGNFAMHTTGVTAMLVVGVLLLLKNPQVEAERRPWLTWLVMALAGTLYLGFHLPANPIPAVVLLALFVFTWRRIVMSQPAEMETTESLSQSIPTLRNLWLLPLAGGLAIFTYALVDSLTPGISSNIALYLITMPLGFGLFGRAIWLSYRKRSKPDQLNATPES